jgi:hypothetical protein
MMRSRSSARPSPSTVRRRADCLTPGPVRSIAMRRQALGGAGPTSSNDPSRAWGRGRRRPGRLSDHENTKIRKHETGPRPDGPARTGLTIGVPGAPIGDEPGCPGAEVGASIRTPSHFVLSYFRAFVMKSRAGDIGSHCRDRGPGDASRPARTPPSRSEADRRPDAERSLTTTDPGGVFQNVLPTTHHDRVEEDETGQLRG